MTSFVKTEQVVECLRGLLGSLPRDRVSLDWLFDELRRIRAELGEESVVISHDAIDSSSDASVISLLDLAEDDGAGELRDHPRLPEIVEGRYLNRAVLGSGGQGIVREVRDRYLDRPVALKLMRHELLGNRLSTHSFLREARITGQLNHAGIVPIYDVGVMPDGAPCYTMRRVRGRSLRDIVIELREFRQRRPGEAGAHVAREFNRRRLIEVLVSAAHTVGYAHDRGVIHRDLKPANLMVGDYGEVLVLDWGIARLLGQSAPDVSDGPVVLAEDEGTVTQQGTIKGTPGYMAPEQAYGDLPTQGPWTDVYALGLILYEVLTGAPGRRPGSSEEVLQVARDGQIEPPEARRLREGLNVPPIPEELAQVCMRCVARPPQDRYPNGEALAAALQGWLDGEQRRELAEARARDAEHKANLLKGMGDDILRAREEARLLVESIEPWAEIEQKRLAWAKEDEVRALEVRRDQTQAEALALFTQALGDDPENPRARYGLARVYFDHLVEAETWGRTREARRYELQVRRFDDGDFHEALQGDGLLELSAEPHDASVWLFDLVERDRRLQPVSQRFLGPMPIRVQLPMGRYLVVVRSGEPAEEIEVVYPVMIRRSGRWEGHIRLYRSIPEGFVLVPGGPFLYGGDRLAPGSHAREETRADDFAIARLPVTCGEYLDFLLALDASDPAEAVRRAPRPSGRGGQEPLWPRGPDGAFRIPRVDILGGRWAADMAVRCVSRDDAEAYCRWRGALEQRPYRLPTEREWEKAGRGVDGRFFPWGNEFDATFCKMKDSRPGAPEPEAVGAFPLDASPYGVQDLAGGALEWVAGPFDRHGIMGIQKGGFWMASQSNCRLARRFGVFPAEPEPFGGFRLAFTPVR